jgi:hypothetical protein
MKKTTHIAGDTLDFVISVSNEGQVQNLNGWVFWWTLKKDIEDADADAVIKKRFVAGDDSKVVLELTANETANLLGTYWSEIKFEMPSGWVGSSIFQIEFVKPVLRTRWT